MITVPDDLFQALREGHVLVAEISPKEPQNRAWVKLDRGHIPTGRIGGGLGPMGFGVCRLELPRAIVEDQNMGPHESDYFEHVERFYFEDIHEAFEKALEYEPDWRNWTRLRDDPDCP